MSATLKLGDTIIPILSWNAESVGMIKEIRRLDDAIIGSMQVPKALIDKTLPTSVSISCTMHFTEHGKRMMREWERAVTRYLWETYARQLVEDALRAYETRAWLDKGGPLAGFYRGRPGWRLADAVERTERN